MPVVINGSTGISGNDGTAAVPTIQGTDTNTGMFFPAADTIAFAEGGVEAMRLDANGNVMVGATTTPVPSNRLTVVGGGVQFSPGTSAQPGVRIQQSSGVCSLTGINNDNNAFNALSFFAGASEAARVTITGDFQFNSGYGSSATAYGCRAWVNFNGQGVVAIRASANVSSITDVGTGNYTINFSNAMPSVNYTIVGAASSDGVANNGFFLSGGSASFLTTSVGVLTVSGGSSGGNLYDAPVVNAAVFR